MTQLIRLLKNDSGVTAIEYGLIAGIMGVVLIAAMPKLATVIANSFSSVAGHIATGK